MLEAPELIASAATPHERDGSVEVVVRRKTAEADGIFSYELVPGADQSLPSFGAGAHIQVFLDNGVTRQYSLCNPHSQPTSYVIAILKEVSSRGGSAYLHDRVHQGDRIHISPPRNHFELVPGKPALLLAAGIGITPIYAMAQELSAQAIPFELHYCARTPKSAAFLSSLQEAPYKESVHFHHSREPGSGRIDVSQVLSKVRPDQHIYVCGPASFIASVLKCAAAQELPSERIHREFFAASEATSTDVDAPFELHLARSGCVLTVSSDQTALAVLTGAGVDLPTSCEVGVCGTCVTRVLEGVPDHRDVYLSDEEHLRNDCFTPCCSRARSPKLVVDL